MPDNPAPAGTTVTQEVPEPVVQKVETFSWKPQLPPDFQNSPTMQKFQDTKEGFEGLVKSHLSLEKLLGNEKVPIPKSKDDTAALTVFRKAMGIPETPAGYNLPDADIPETMKGLTFDKAKFAESIHKHDLTPAQAKGAWQDYTDMMKQAYSNAQKAHQEKMTGIQNEMRKEWGDAYQSKVELGQMVINKFSDDKETNDFLTAALVADPRGIKFLAKLGEQFTENKIGDFKYQRNALTPEEAQTEWDSIRQDMNHPYNNDKAPKAERDRAIEYVNSLIAVARRPKG